MGDLPGMYEKWPEDHHNWGRASKRGEAGRWTQRSCGWGGERADHKDFGSYPY